MSPFEVFGLASDASPDDVKQAYRRLAMEHHPDRGGDVAEFYRIQRAYDAALIEATEVANRCPWCKGTGQTQVVNGWNKVNMVCHGCGGQGVR